MEEKETLEVLCITYHSYPMQHNFLLLRFSQKSCQAEVKSSTLSFCYWCFAGAIVLAYAAVYAHEREPQSSNFYDELWANSILFLF